jgi:hypothetical protein
MQSAADPAYDFRLIKVGITQGDVAARIGHLQTGNPYELRCLSSFDTPCASQVERFIHRTHASEMHHREWLRRRHEDVDRLIEEAKSAATRFEEQKKKEDAITCRTSNGLTRRADGDEIKLHRQVRALKDELVPAQLRLTAAENQLKALTEATNGIEGVVRVTHVAATIRFSPERAQFLYSSLVDRCSFDDVSGRFRWRNVPRQSRFPSENQAATEAEAIAHRRAQAVLSAHTRLEGWLHRTHEIERLHDDVLQLTQVTSRLEADLADLRTEFTIRMGEFDAIEPICSFKRVACRTVDWAKFYETYPDEAAQCAESVPARLSKFVYQTRSYV